MLEKLTRCILPWLFILPHALLHLVTECLQNSQSLPSVPVSCVRYGEIYYASGLGPTWLSKIVITFEAGVKFRHPTPRVESSVDWFYSSFESCQQEARPGKASAMNHRSHGFVFQTWIDSVMRYLPLESCWLEELETNWEIWQMYDTLRIGIERLYRAINVEHKTALFELK